MHYPPPMLPPMLSFLGTATFMIRQQAVGGADIAVAVRCDATGRVLCWCLTPPTQLRFAVMCDITISCAGTLNDGRSFRCPDLVPISWPSDGLSPDALVFRAQQFIIGSDGAAPESLFALTNLLLPNFSSHAAASLSLGDVTATLTPGPDYSERMKHLRAYKGTDVTATLCLSSSISGVELCTVAHDLCLILSVLTGHKVNWVSRQTATALIFEDRVTKPCSGWPVIGTLEKVLGKEWGWKDLLGETLRALPQFKLRSACYPMRTGLIDSWIDARIGTDFLESRCLKTVAVLEVIKSAYRDNRQLKGSFRDLLKGVHLDLAVSIPTDVLDEIVKLRNCIVHEGTFLSPPSTKKTKVEQYEMLCHYSDRLMVTLAGHSL